MKLKNIAAGISLAVLTACTSYPLLEDVRFPSDYTYIIGAGDSLEIFVWGNPDISRSVTVRPDGKLTAPLINDFLANGKTPYQLAREIEKELSKYIRDPQVAVIVGGFEGVYEQQVRVIGQISGGGGGSGSVGGGMGGMSGGMGMSGSSMGGGGGFGGGRYSAKALPYRYGMTLLDLMIAMGGIGQYGDGNRATIIRKVDNELQQFGVRIDDLIEDGDMSANVNILPGDLLIIPEAFF